MAKKVLDALAKKLGDALVATSDTRGEQCAEIPRDKLVETVTFLRDDPELAFDSPVFVTCIDRLGDDGPRFEVVYQLRSHTHRHCLRLKVRVTEDDAVVPSLSSIFPAFNWQERETFDMYGIVFDGHPDLRRIYMYEEFVGYPLRKDYPKDKRQPLVRREWTDEPTEA